MNVIEHDMTFVRQIAQTVTVLDEGMNCAKERSMRSRIMPSVIEVYLGQDKETHVQIQQLVVSVRETAIVRGVDLDVARRGGLPDGAATASARRRLLQSVSG